MRSKWSAFWCEGQNLWRRRRRRRRRCRRGQCDEEKHPSSRSVVTVSVVSTERESESAEFWLKHLRKRIPHYKFNGGNLVLGVK